MKAEAVASGKKVRVNEAEARAMLAAMWPSEEWPSPQEAPARRVLKRLTNLATRQPEVNPEGKNKALFTLVTTCLSDGGAVELIDGTTGFAPEDDGGPDADDGSTEPRGRRGRSGGKAAARRPRGGGETAAERDAFGSRPGTNRAKANSAMANAAAPLSMAGIIKAARLSGSVSTHVADLMKRGLVGREGRGYVLTARGRKVWSGGRGRK